MFHMLAFIVAAEAAAPTPPPEGGMSKAIINIIFAVGGAIVAWLWKKPGVPGPGPVPAPAPGPSPAPSPDHPTSRPVVDMVAELITWAFTAMRGLNPIRDQAILIALGQLKAVLDQLGIQPIQLPLPTPPTPQMYSAMPPKETA